MSVLQALQHGGLHVVPQAGHLHGRHAQRTREGVVVAGTQAGGVQVVPVPLGHHGPVHRVLPLQLPQQRPEVEVGVLLPGQEAFQLRSLEQQFNGCWTNLLTKT